MLKKSLFNILLAAILICSSAWAAEIPLADGIDQERLADAIYLAEGGVHAKVPYGILSVKTKNPRQTCLDTINNNLARWQWARQNGDKRGFIEFLGNRYAPISAHKLNKHWVSNVLKLYGTLNQPKSGLNAHAMVNGQS